MVKVIRTANPAGKVLREALNQLTGARGRVGWFSSAVYPEGVPVALVAAVQEFGWPEHNIPPRLGMRATTEANREVWAEVAKNQARAVIAGTSTARNAMEAIGLKAAGDIRKHITEVTSPPLKVDTVKARLRGRKQGNYVLLTIAKPLVHTGHLLATLTNDTEGVK